METFNILIFKEKKVDGEYFFTLDDGTEVMQIEWPPEYYEEKIKKPKSPFQLYRQYYYFSGKLKLSGTFFYNSPYGIWKEYDETGNRINIKDYEKNFEFSIDKLDHLMHKMGVDILIDQPGVYVNRSSSGKSLYAVEYPINFENPYSLNKIIIDGNTGEIIKKTIIEKE